MTGRSLLRIVERLGCERVRQRGSHVIVRCPGGCQTVIAIHNGQDIPGWHSPIDRTLPRKLPWKGLVDMTYTAVYKRDEGDTWAVAIKGLKGCQTYGRSLRQARERIREALALWLDCDEDALDIHDQYPSSVAAVTVRVARARDEAQRAGSKAQQQTLEAVKTLTDLGLSRRDAGELLGISHQRIQQLLQAS